MPSWRPNRTLLMTGLIVFGAPYVASVGIAATSPHVGDSDLWIPVIGPYFDLGARGGCPSDTSDCGPETGNKVLLVGDGVLQTIGALEIVGAFVFPEHPGVTTIVTSKNTSLSVTPVRMGAGGYGVSAVGDF